MYIHAQNNGQKTGCTGPIKVCKDQALKLLSSYDAKLNKDNWPNADTIIDDARRHAQEKALTGAVWSDGRDTFKTELGNQTYYITEAEYFILSAAERATLTDTSTKRYPGYCEFYLYDKNMHYVSSYAIKVGNGKAETHCNSIYGVSGVAFHGQPALLAIAQFFYTDVPATSSIDQIGADYIRTAVLLPLAQQPDGTWIFTQDMTCFPLTNTIDNLAEARKRLENCR